MRGCPEFFSPSFKPLEFAAKLTEINARLKADRVRVAISVKGGALLLRATLPPKPGSAKAKPYQQKVYIRKPANLAGLREAEKLARLLGGQIVADRFSWAEWGSARTAAGPTCGEAIAKFERHYLNQGGSVDTWQGDYLKVYKRLPQNAPIGPDVLTALAESTAPNTRTRQRFVVALAALARHAGVEWDGKALKGSYSPKKTAPRELPSDKLISDCRNALVNPAWRWVYGVMACYGLRNHEVFHLDLESFPIVKVLEDTKTGYREVWPCYPEWAERWQLQERQLPPVQLDRPNQKIGHSVTKYLSPKLTFAPYDLRHAWAVRTLLFGWPVELSARQMGHSVEVHTRTYQRWISREQIDRVYQILVARSDRPMPPD